MLCAPTGRATAAPWLVDGGRASIDVTPSQALAVATRVRVRGDSACGTVAVEIKQPRHEPRQPDGGEELVQVATYAHLGPRSQRGLELRHRQAAGTRQRRGGIGLKPRPQPVAVMRKQRRRAARADAGQCRE